MTQFLDLPLELREEIYRLALPRNLGAFSRAHDRCIMPACSRNPANRRRATYSAFHLDPPTEEEEEEEEEDSLALLTVSKSVGSEVSRLIRRELRFSFHCLGSLARATVLYPSMAAHFRRDLRIWMTLWEWIGLTHPAVATARSGDYEQLMWDTFGFEWCDGGRGDENTSQWSHVGDPVVMGAVAGETPPRSERLEIVVEMHLPSEMEMWADRVWDTIAWESIELPGFLDCADERTYVSLRNVSGDRDIALIRFNVAEVKREARRGRTGWEEVNISCVEVVN